jgi:hypothetical protein
MVDKECGIEPDGLLQELPAASLWTDELITFDE